MTPATKFTATEVERLEVKARTDRRRARSTFENEHYWERPDTTLIPGLNVTEEQRLARLREMEEFHRNPPPNPFLAPEFFERARRDLARIEQQESQARRAAAYRELYGEQRLLSPPQSRDRSPSQTPMPRVAVVHPHLHQTQDAPARDEHQLPLPTLPESSVLRQVPAQQVVQGQQMTLPGRDLAVTGNTERDSLPQINAPPPPEQGIIQQRLLSPKTLPRPPRKTSTTTKIISRPPRKDSKIIKRSHRNQRAGIGARAEDKPTKLLELAFAGRKAVAQFQEKNRP